MPHSCFAVLLIIKRKQENLLLQTQISLPFSFFCALFHAELCTARIINKDHEYANAYTLVGQTQALFVFKCLELAPFFMLFVYSKQLKYGRVGRKNLQPVLEISSKSHIWSIKKVFSSIVNLTIIHL